MTSKDVLTSKTRKFFIKNILNKGAAIKDGRLEAGDELIEVFVFTFFVKKIAEENEAII